MANELDPYTGIYPASNGGTELSYRALVSKLPQEILNKYQIICSRVRKFDDTKKQILWLHDWYLDPENDHLKIKTNHDKFEKMVFVTNHQFQTYHQAFGIQYDKSIIIRNAIEPISMDLNLDRETPTIVKPNPNEELRLIYHTTPHRGLDILAIAYAELVKHFPNLRLDVFSSFSIYGWSQRDDQYKQLFDFLQTLPGVHYHGTQPNETVREYLKQAHVFAYPSTWPETSCIAAIEAAAAGCYVVTPDYAALPETLLGNGIHYRYSENKDKHINVFANTMYSVLKRIEDKSFRDNMLQTLTNQHHRFNGMYSWQTRMIEWNGLLSG